MSNVTFAKYVFNKDTKRNTLFRIQPDGKSYYIIGEKRMTVEEMDKSYPTDVFPTIEGDRRQIKGENVDKTREWLNGRKSY